jgi:hypothetical protein
MFQGSESTHSMQSQKISLDFILTQPYQKSIPDITTGRQRVQGVIFNDSSSQNQLVAVNVQQMKF